MFSAADVEGTPEFKKFSMFKAWWDIVLDYLVAGTALNVILLLTRMATVDTAGLICMHPIQGYSFGYVESRYVNSRCCSASEAYIIVFYPYIMLLFWMIITASHICWVRIPSINTKMEAFYAILYKIFTTQPKFYRNPTSLRMTSELSYNEANQKTVDVLLNKLLYLMTENPFLRTSYIAKHVVVVIFCTISVALAVLTIAYLSDFPTNFNCKLIHNPPTMRGIPFTNGTVVPIPCHLNIGPFIYVLIFVDLAIRVAMIIFSTKGIIWSVQARLRKTRPNIRLSIEENMNVSSNLSSEPSGEEDPFGEAAEYLSGLPSYPDLLFCIKLLKRNVHDGNLMYDAILTSIKNYVERLKVIGEKYKKECERAHGASSTKKEEKVCGYQPKSYHEYIIFVKWMTHELGLEEVPNTFDNNNLFECLDFIKNSLGIVDLRIESDMRTVIVSHLRSHPELYKTLIDEDITEHCEKMESHSHFGSHHAIQAAATLFNVKIIIVHCEFTLKSPEVFVPLRHNLLLTGNLRSTLEAENLKGVRTNVSTRFLTYVAPYFYHATVDMPLSPDWPNIVSRRMNYTVDRKFRRDLRHSAMRSVMIERDKNV